MSALSANPYRTSLRTAADWGLVAIAVLTLAALALPVGALGGAPVGWFGGMTGGTLAPLFLIGVVLAVVAGRSAPKRVWGAWVELGGVALAWLLPLHLLNEGMDLSAAGGCGCSWLRRRCCCGG
ncbi:hypothetical protein [Azospirillum sp. INR13]|uniref:hypothetical protein n=1 Tax=Azospirillum sp. INR13 TaxID=2596919 RepID=UPI00210342EE|nr:hypothetical protein [Azospirillum sp. INR13]